VSAGLKKVPLGGCFFSSFIVPVFFYGIPTFGDGTFVDVTFGDRVLWEIFRKESHE
jgi:hypothetical protein